MKEYSDGKGGSFEIEQISGNECNEQHIMYACYPSKPKECSQCGWGKEIVKEDIYVNELWDKCIKEDKNPFAEFKKEINKKTDREYLQEIYDLVISSEEYKGEKMSPPHYFFYKVKEHIKEWKKENE